MAFAADAALQSHANGFSLQMTVDRIDHWASTYPASYMMTTMCS